jgi:hypothetical protein
MKSSNHKLVLVGATAMFLAAGCEVSQPQAPDRTDPVPISTDDAMRARQWQPTPAVYPSMSSTTGPSDVALVPCEKLSAPAQGAVETPLFLADLLLMPIAMVEAPPWTQVEGSAFYVLPTYTANPPSIPARGNDLSGGPGTVYNAAAGRAVNPQPPPQD